MALKLLSSGRQTSLLAGHLREPAQDAIAIGRIELDKPRPPARLLRRDKGRAGAGERIEHNLAALRAISDRIGDQSDRLCRRMHAADGVVTLLCAQSVWNIAGPKMVKCPLNSARLRASA